MQRFWYKLALELKMTVSEAKERISRTEFEGWLAYDRIDPIGRNRFDALVSMIISYMVSLKTGKENDSSKFMPKWFNAVKDKSKEWNAQMKVYANMVNKKCQQ